MRSAIYTGWVSHCRYTPKVNAFRYRVFMMYLHLTEVDQVLQMSPFWSRKRGALARFKREDFHGDPEVDLDEALRRTIEEELDWRPKGDIAVLANLRYFGFNMNPLCTYYCFDEGGDKIEAIVAEVTNTPWGERRAYVLDFREHGDVSQHRTHFQKDFTVSPFNTLDMDYTWRSSYPGDDLRVHINCQQSGKKIVDAGLELQRQDISRASLHQILWHYPFMTIKVCVGIYWQALKLFVKGVPFLGKNKRSSDNIKAVE